MPRTCVCAQQCDVVALHLHVSATSFFAFCVRCCDGGQRHEIINKRNIFCGGLRRRRRQGAALSPIKCPANVRVMWALYRVHFESGRVLFVLAESVARATAPVFAPSLAAVDFQLFAFRIQRDVRADCVITHPLTYISIDATVHECSAYHLYHVWQSLWTRLVKCSRISTSSSLFLWRDNGFKLQLRRRLQLDIAQDRPDKNKRAWVHKW